MKSWCISFSDSPIFSIAFHTLNIPYTSIDGRPTWSENTHFVCFHRSVFGRASIHMSVISLVQCACAAPLPCSLPTPPLIPSDSGCIVYHFAGLLEYVGRMGGNPSFSPWWWIWGRCERHSLKPKKKNYISSILIRNKFSFQSGYQREGNWMQLPICFYCIVILNCCCLLNHCKS